MASRQMMKPQAWIPVPRTVPSNIFAYLIVFARCGSVDAHVFEKLGFTLIETIPESFELPGGIKEDRLVFQKNLEED